MSVSSNGNLSGSVGGDGGDVLMTSTTSDDTSCDVDGASARVDDLPIADGGVAGDDLSALSAVARTLAAGVGFMTDAYDIVVINIVVVVISAAMKSGATTDGASTAPAVTDDNKSLIATAGLCGAVVGQLSFGVIADVVGRRVGFILTLVLLIVGAVASALSYANDAVSLFAALAISRFVLGVGIGGEYPLASTVSSEAAVQVAGRGRRVASVFSMQGIGFALAPLLVLLLLAVTSNYDTVWRVALGIGAVPAFIMLIPRATTSESEVYQRAPTLSLYQRMLLLSQHRRALLSTCGNWFIFDVVFYANSLFSAQILQSFQGQNADEHAHLVSVTVSTLYLSLLALPGYWASVMLIDRIGRKNLCMFGYSGMFTTYALCGTLIGRLQSNQSLFYALYGLTFFFCNCGPNATTFVTPSESFPTSVRGTATGIASAAGKIGAVIGGAIMPSLLSATSLSVVMFVSAALSAVGLVFTLVLQDETMNASLVGTPTDDADIAPAPSKPTKTSLRLRALRRTHASATELELINAPALAHNDDEDEAESKQTTDVNAAKDISTAEDDPH